MDLEQHFAADSEFRNLVARESDVDLVRIALEIARDADPNLDFADTLQWLDAQAEALKPTVLRARSDAEAFAALCEHLGQTCGLHGDSESYRSAESSYLNRVIETRRGIPISLSVIYMAIADRIGLELKGVAAPAHFLTRYDLDEGPIFIDAFDSGRQMTTSECVEWLSDIAEMEDQDIWSTLRPVSPRSITIRMLNNLKVLHAANEDWKASHRVQLRLTALKPGSYEERRDLAILTSRINATSQAIRLLEQCLTVCPDCEREMLQGLLDQAHRNHSRWN